MFALQSQRLRRRLSAPTSGSARRRARERFRAEQTRQEGERLAQERREQRYREKLEHQRQAREELASYEPWGRAGGGAPNPNGVRFTKIRSREIYPEDELKGVAQIEPCFRWPTPRHRRIIRRTPLRLREDPQLCYADNLRQSVDNDIRYRQTPVQQRHYKQALDDLVDKRRKAINEEIKNNLEYERRMHAMEGPWGRPGPGGTTWRNPRNIGLNFSQSMGWTDNEIFNKMTGDYKRCKRSSLTLPKVKRDDDSKENYAPYNEHAKASTSNIDKLPDINQSNSANGKSREGKNGNNVPENKEAKTSKGSSNGNSDGNGSQVKSPNGKSNKSNGNGNHKGNRSPTKHKFVKRLSNGDRVRKVVPDKDFDNRAPKNGGEADCTCEKKPSSEATILGLTGGVELVPLLARRRRVGARTLPSSDVTRPPEQFCQWREMLNMDYLRDLKNQIRVKYEQKEESRRDSAESVRRHHETWASLWGRPGHGAPQCRGKYARSNLAQLLYAPRRVAPLGNSL